MWQTIDRWVRAGLGALAILAVVAPIGADGGSSDPRAPAADSITLPAGTAVAYPPGFHCAYRPAEEWLAGFRAAVDRREIPDPQTRSIPSIPQRVPSGRQTRSLTTADLYPFEDTDQLLLTDWTLEQIMDLMVTAANDLLSTYGDNYDFIGFWLNFEPHHRYGGAFFWSLENDVLGIGKDLFNYRSDYGLAGENIEGMVMLYNVNSYWWDPPGGAYSDFTRLMISHEFEHRWAVRLPPLLDGRNLQGEADATVGGPCGKVGHWSYKVDGQGSAMEIREWVGFHPAVLDAQIWSFSNDIPGGVFSYPDLYLMGYVSPAEMDAGASELRYVEQSPECASPHQGPMTSFSSAHIIAAAGPRVPDSASSQKQFRTGWIMIHLPGDPPDQAELEKAVAILEEHQLVWTSSTLGRGTMDHSLGDLLAGVDAVRTVGGDQGNPTLAPPIPNPLLSQTVVHYALTEKSRVALTVHDVTGRRVVTLDEGIRSAGERSVRWNGLDETGSRVASGVYFVRLEVDGFTQTSKLLVVR